MINKELIEKYYIDEIVINVFINIGLISVFIGIFFFTYVSIVEKEIIQKQSEIITTDLISIIKPYISSKDSIKLKNNLSAPNMSKEDKEAKESNDKLKNTAYNNMIFIFSVCIVSSLLLSIYFIKPEHNYIYTILINLVLLIIVGLTEYLFLKYILANYIIGDPNYVKYRILKSLKNKLILK